jgi:hypothetical protein
MASPQESASNDIDLFSSDETASPRSADPCPGPIEFADSPVRARRYHSMQLAIVTGLFACGGFLCSLFFVEGDAEFPQPHHWLRKSYSSPAMIMPPAPPAASIIPQHMLPRPNQQNKTAALQHRQISHREFASTPSHADRSSSGIGPVTALRTKWTNFSENVRDRATSARNQTLDFGRRLRQYHFEPRRLFVPEDTAINTNDAG